MRKKLSFTSLFVICTLFFLISCEANINWTCRDEENVSKDNEKIEEEKEEEKEIESSLFSDFYNYPNGKMNDNGTLTISNNVAQEVLVFTSEVAGKNYIGTIPANSTIKVKLDDEKFYTVIGVCKTTYEDKQSLAAQTSCLTYYSNTQTYTVSVSPSNLTGAGKWIFNNNTNYWASIESVTNDGNVFAVIAPSAKRVEVPIELNKAYDYKIVYKKELKYNNKVLAIADSSVVSDNDTVQLDETLTQFTTDLNGTSTKLADDLAPSVLFINNYNKSLRIYNGQIQLSNIGSTTDDYVIMSGRTAMITGFTAGTSTSGIGVRSNALNGNQLCTESLIMEKAKVYRITVEVNTDTTTNSTNPIKWTVVEETATNYYDE